MIDSKSNINSDYLYRSKIHLLLTLVLMHKKIMFYFFVLTMVISCTSKKEEPKQNKSPQITIVDVIVASSSFVSNIVEANGSVVANEYVELHPEISGRLIYLNVPEGKIVQQGTIIARINDADLQAQLQKQKVGLDLAIKTEERLRKLLAVNGVNQADYDAAKTSIDSYKADIAYTEAMIDKTIIRAPFSGTVGLRQVSNGAYLTPASLIATVQQNTKMKVDFTIPESYSKQIKIGSNVDIETADSKGTKKKATIIAIEPQINIATRNLKVRAIINGDGINAGTFVKVYVAANVDAKAILVPTTCIIPDDKNKQLVVVKGGKANFVSVETGVRQTDNIEITKGVNIGDTVIVTGLLFVRPKGLVKIRSVKTLEQLIK